MNTQTKAQLPTHLTLTALFSAGLTITLSVIFMVLSIIALIYRYDCEAIYNITFGDPSLLMKMVYFLYVQDAECHSQADESGMRLKVELATPYVYQEDITQSHTVFVMLIMILLMSVLCFTAAVALITAVKHEVWSLQYVHLVAYVYVGICIASFVVDLTLGVHFGMDYGSITSFMKRVAEGESPGSRIIGSASWSIIPEEIRTPSSEDSALKNALNMHIYDIYFYDMLRFGAFVMMTISMKGLVTHAINLIFLVLLLVFVIQYQRSSQKNEHPIHKRGVVDAYEQQRRQEDAWQPQPEMFMGMSRGQHLNPAFINEEEHHPRSPMRDQPPISDYSNSRGMYDRSDSWIPGPMSSARSDTWQPAPTSTARSDSYQPGPLSSMRSDTWQTAPLPGSRPFSYLEESKRTAPVKAPASPAVDPQWRRDWSSPPVPAPDYSPQTPRRLKSALKPGYM